MKIDLMWLQRKILDKLGLMIWVQIHLTVKDAEEDDWFPYIPMKIGILRKKNPSFHQHPEFISNEPT